MSIFNSPKKRHFTKMLKDVTRTIWEKEFSKFKALARREDVRLQYDRAKQAVVNMKAAKQDQAKIDEVEKAIKGYEAKMKSVDQLIYGVAPTEADPEGTPGIQDQLDGFIELRTCLQDYLNEYC